MEGQNIEAIYPLSPGQQGMLFESLRNPGDGLFVEQLAFRLHGLLDEEAFAGAWRRVLARHPTLRTGFVWKSQDEPLQFVLRDVVAPIRT
jgi:Condensation domain